MQYTEGHLKSFSFEQVARLNQMIKKPASSLEEAVKHQTELAASLLAVHDICTELNSALGLVFAKLNESSSRRA